jgi:hypothetical protein
LYEVQEDICQIYGQLQQQQHFGRQHHSNNTCNTFHQNDPLLATFPVKNEFMCCICGKMSHKATECWDHPNNKDKPCNSCFQKRNDQPRLPYRTNFRSSNHPSTNQASANTTTTAKPTCTYCNKPNHTETNCFKKQADLRNKTNNQTNPNEAADVILVASPMELGLATTQRLSDKFLMVILALPATCNTPLLVCSVFPRAKQQCLLVTTRQCIVKLKVLSKVLSIIQMVHPILSS